MAAKKKDTTSDNLTGSEKAAVFLLTLGEEFTSEVFKRLDHDEIKVVGRQMSKMDKVDKDDIAELLSEFRSDEGGDEIYLSGDDLLETALKKALNVGEANDIHPMNKQDVGYRLSLAARGLAYSENIVYSGPVYRSIRIEGDKARIIFDHTGSGLIAKGGNLKGFTIAGKDGIFVRAEAIIKGKTVIVQSAKVSDPVAVRYAWADNP